MKFPHYYLNTENEKNIKNKMRVTERLEFKKNYSNIQYFQKYRLFQLK